MRVKRRTGVAATAMTAVTAATVAAIGTGAADEPDTAVLTVTAVDQDGDPVEESDDVWPRVIAVYRDGSEVAYPDPHEWIDGRTEVELPKGEEYDLVLILDDFEKQRQTMWIEFGVSLDGDTALTFDGADTAPVSVVTERESDFDYGAFAAEWQPGGAHVASGSAEDLWLGSNEAPASRGFVFAYREHRVSPAGAGRDYTYNLVFTETGGLPEHPGYRVVDDELAAVDTDYRGRGAAGPAWRTDAPRIGGGPDMTNLMVLPEIEVPSRRTELYTADDGITWVQAMLLHDPDHFPGPSYSGQGLVRLDVFEAGTARRTWAAGPFGAAFRDLADPYGEEHQGGIARHGNTIRLTASLLAPASGEAAMFDPENYDAVEGGTTLLRDGEVVAANDTPGYGEFEVPSRYGRYTLRASVSDTSAWDGLGTAAEIEWTFDSLWMPRPKALPAVLFGFTGDLDEHNSAPAGQSFALGLTVERSANAKAAAPTLEVSFDDGATWEPVAVTADGDRYTAAIEHPDTDGFASLRVSADQGRNSVTQTVIRAYQIAAR
jgi:hypothetical protein